jgi:hypothetical protein
MSQDRRFFDQSVTSSGSAILPQWEKMECVLGLVSKLASIERTEPDFQLRAA